VSHCEIINKEYAGNSVTSVTTRIEAIIRNGPLFERGLFHTNCGIYEEETPRTFFHDINMQEQLGLIIITNEGIVRLKTK